MASGPTTGASDSAPNAWTSRPGTARAVRVAAFVAPAVIAWVVSSRLAPHLWRPAGTLGTVAFVLQLALAGITTVSVAGRVTRRVLPLATLLNLALVFPDQAPSRFRTALRGGTLRNLQSQVDDFRAATDGRDLNEVATQIVEMVATLGRHERLTRGHTERVRAYSDLIAEQMGLSAHERHLLQWSALLHDIGKLAVPAQILNKAGRPTDEEWAILASHPAVGGELVEPLAPWLGEWRLAAGEHHERWDGTGYPRGLAGTEISLAGRIVAVADAYDVITSHRSYKKPMTAAAARAELVRCSGTQFDPVVVRAFVNASLGKTSIAAGSAGWIGQLQALMNAGASGAVAAAGNVAAAAAVVGTVALTGVPAPGPTLDAAPALLPGPDAARRDDTSTTSSAPGSSTTAPGSSTSAAPVAPASTTTEPAVEAVPPSTAGTTPPTTAAAPGTTEPPPLTPPVTTAPPTSTTSPPVGATESPECDVARRGNGSVNGADLRSCVLQGQTLEHLDLAATDLRGADLRNVTITMASLRDADLRGADLRGATIQHVDLEHTDLRGADLRGTSFVDVDLDDADLRNARIEGTRFGHAALGEADFANAIGTAIDEGFTGWYRTRCPDGTRRDTSCFAP